MNFDALAPHYDWMENVLAGTRLVDARRALLGELGPCSRVLSVGEGHGRFAEAFVARFPGSRLVCLEQSPRMLAKAQERLRRATAAGDPIARVEWRQGDVLSWPGQQRSFDAIVTCFFLDCFPPEQLERVIARLSTFARPEARWLNVDFAIPERGIGRARARVVHAVMYSFFRFATNLPARQLTPPARFLTAHLFRRTRRLEFNFGLLSAELWDRAAPLS